MASEFQVLNHERVQALETWLGITQIQLTQVNGQRKYGGPPEVWEGPSPGAHCEVFISQIPRDAYEDLLIPVFSSVGPLWEFRLMMNFSGQNRGFAYAKYGSSAAAAEAIRLLNGYMLEPGARLSVRHSTEKRNLCIDGLPLTTSQNRLLQVLRLLTEGVDGLSVITLPGVVGVSAKVTYSSHQAASMAKKILVEAFKRQFALSISVRWDSSVRPTPPPKPSRNNHKRPPHHLHHSAQPCSALPPPVPHRPSIPPGFCSAVGGPTARQHLGPPSAAPFSQGRLLSAASPVMLPCKSCEATEADQQLYGWSPSMTRFL